MTRKKIFLIIQTVLCTVIAVLLAAGALSLFLNGTAKQPEGDPFYYIFTREKVGTKLLPVLPLLVCAIGMTAAGVILGVKDESAEKPVQNEKLLRDLCSMQKKAVSQKAAKKTKILRIAFLLLALILIAIGILNGGLYDLLTKGTTICTECIGLG